MTNYSITKRELQEVTTKLNRALGNHKRAQFILYLGENPNSSFTNLLFNTPTGPMNPASLKFHMDVLMESKIVERKQRGCYSLTDLGIASYETLKYLSKLLNDNESF